MPPGHPEGYLEGFANIYGGAADAIRAVQSGADRDAALGLLPGIGAGLDGMAFIGACVRSSQDNTAWVTL